MGERWLGSMFWFKSWLAHQIHLEITSSLVIVTRIDTLRFAVASDRLYRYVGMSQRSLKVISWLAVGQWLQPIEDGFTALGQLRTARYGNMQLNRDRLLDIAAPGAVPELAIPSKI